MAPPSSSPRQVAAPGRSTTLAGVFHPALLTDHYELTMIDAALSSGVSDHRAVFEVFARSLPAGRRYGVVAGTARLVDLIAGFRFDDVSLAYLSERHFLRPATLDWLAGFRFGGNVRGYREGELYFPGSPVLTVEGSFAEALILETVVLSVLNHDSAIASAAARMVWAAQGRTLIEAGSRRTHELAAVAAARAAYLVGFTTSSNLHAGLSFGVPTGGTASHAFILAYPCEADAFAAQIAQTGPATTLLVDTFDIEQGIRTAVAVAGPDLGAVRIDSGNAAAEARRARALLDELGASHTRVIVSGDLDEHAIAALAGAPVDAMLVGTEVVTGSGVPTAKFVYKLVAVAAGPGRDAPLHDVAKRSLGKETQGGRKAAFRRVGPEGRAVAELLARDGQRRGGGSAGANDGSRLRPLQVEFVGRGEAVATIDTDLPAARDHHRASLAEFSADELSIAAGPPLLEATWLD